MTPTCISIRLCLLNPLSSLSWRRITATHVICDFRYTVNIIEILSAFRMCIVYTVNNRNGQLVKLDDRLRKCPVCEMWGPNLRRHWCDRDRPDQGGINRGQGGPYVGRLHTSTEGPDMASLAA